MVPVTEPEELDDEIVPPLSPTKPPTVLFDPVLVTAPVAVEVVTSPGPFPKVSVPINPPSTLLPPPVTVPVAELDRIVPSPVPTKPPATLASPTVTEPRALDPAMRAVLFTQPAQFEPLMEFEATTPPAVLPLPACTLPSATDDWMAPELLPTRPPACRFATFGPPTLPRAKELEIRPWLASVSP